MMGKCGLSTRIIPAVLALLAVFGCITGVDAQDPAPNVIDALAGLKTQLNTVNSTADLTCESSRMVVSLTFARPFFGRILAENDPSDMECQRLDPPIDGLTNYRYYIPLKKCGTKQISLREFENTFQIRFNKRSTDIQLGDERKTILCRYPPPVVPPIVPVPPPIPAVVPPVAAASVSELELLLIIAAVLFLGALLLGLCCVWWCCKRRRAKKLIESEGVLIEAPEVMKLSGTTLPFQIPRARTSQEGSDVSETALIQRLEGSVSGSGEILPVVPYVTQETKGYELQEASMVLPAPSIIATETTEGEAERQVTTVDRELEHTAVLRRVPKPAMRPEISEADRETASEISEAEMEHTLVASRIPQRPLSPPVSEYDREREVRSVSEMTETSLTRQLVLTRTRPPPPKPKTTSAEVEIETHSVVESLENELILRAVPYRRQLRLPPAEPEPPVETVTTTTETMVHEERVYPRRQPVVRTDEQTTMETTISRQDIRRAPEPVFTRPVPTTRTTTEQETKQETDVYFRRPAPQPPSVTTTTVEETDIREEFVTYPPRQYPSTRTQRPEVIREFPPRGPYNVEETTTDTETRWEFEQRPRPGPAPIRPTTATVTEQTDTESIFASRGYPPRRYPTSGMETTMETTSMTEEIYQRQQPRTERLGPRPTGSYTTSRDVVEERYLDTEFTSRRPPGQIVEEETHRTMEVDYSRPPGYDDYRMDERSRHETEMVRRVDRPESDRPLYTSVFTRDVQHQLDIGTPPKRSPAASEVSPYQTTSQQLPSQRYTETISRDVRQRRYTEEPAPSEVEVPMPVEWSVVEDVLHQLPVSYGTVHVPALPDRDVDLLYQLMTRDDEFQEAISHSQTVFDLYHIRYSPPYDSYFSYQSWTTIIHVFIWTLHLRPPHPGDEDFIEPGRELFMTRYTPDRLSEISSTFTASNYDRALSEYTDDVPMWPARTGELGVVRERPGAEGSWTSSRGRSMRTTVEERSVSEYYEDVPIQPYNRGGLPRWPPGRSERETDTESLAEL